MFGFLLVGGNVTAQSTQTQIPRGVQPTYVTDTTIVLCKKSSSIQNTYEIRLALFFAANDHKHFELRVPMNAKVDPKLSTLLSQHGGSIRNCDSKDFTISVTHFDKDGKERDSWVLGDNDAWNLLLQSLRSPWLKSEMKPGAIFSNSSLLRLEQELLQESLQLKNIDHENVQVALQRNVQDCISEGGYIVLQ